MRYMIKFKKEGDMVFISHLDMQRLFHRAFKRMHIPLLYSQGFNPHPRLSFAQPLSLGHYSVAEYLEFDAEPLKMDFTDFIVGINDNLPADIRVTSIRELPETGKSIASRIVTAEYEIEIPFFFSYKEDISSFMECDVVLVQKKQKKKKEMKEVNIRPMVFNLEGNEVDNNSIMLKTIIATGSASNLNPEILLGAFYEHSHRAYDRYSVRICRTALNALNGNNLVSLDQIT